MPALAAVIHRLPSWRILGRALCALALGAPLAALAGVARAEPPRTVFLIQNSGWMQPYFADPDAKFRAELEAFIQGAAPPGAAVTIASFNQAGQTASPSPLPLFSGTLTPEAVRDAVGRIDMPRKRAAPKVYTDADFDGALSDAITKLLGQRPGVIWMVTNNKNAPNNDPHVTENTSLFSKRITESDAISQVVAYPLRLAARGEFEAKGLVIYGIAYGPDAAGSLRQATDGAPLRSMIADRPVRIKPLDDEPLILSLDGAAPGDVRFASDGGRIVASGVPGGTESVIEFAGRLTSAYYPQVIEHARLQADWAPDDGSPPVAASITPETIDGMGPDEALDGVRLRLSVPKVDRPPGLAGLLQETGRISGRLRLQLTDVRLGLQPAFVAKMRDLFGDNASAAAALVEGRRAELPAALPAVFLGHEAVTEAATVVPVTLGLVFSAVPLFAAAGAAALAMAALLGLLVALTRERTYRLPVGAETLTVSLRAFRSAKLQSRDGIRVAVTGRLLGPAKIVKLP